LRSWSILFALAALFAIGAFVYAPMSPDWWLPNAPPGFDLRLMSWGDGSGVPTSGENLVIGSTDSDGLLHIRRFDAIGVRTDTFETKDSGGALHLEFADATGKVVSDELESSLPATPAGAITKFKQQLPDLLPPHVLSGDERGQVLIRVTSILDHTASLNGVSAGPLHTISTSGREVDHLFVIILWITGIVFVGTEATLVWVAWRYVDRPGRVATYFHGSQRLEVVWTIIPAAILVFIALYQMGAWANIKFRSAMPKVQPLAEVTARQFQWMIRYPGPDGKLRTADDLFTVNDLHFVKDRTALIHLRTSDVLHSFYLPQMRIKQDAVPGLTIPVWFDSDRAGSFELACAELCGWGHYKMKAKVTVHETQAAFDEWEAGALAEQNRSQLALRSGPQGR
jgi:cytochrome c oxidase subunit 2